MGGRASRVWLKYIIAFKMFLVFMQDMVGKSRGNYPKTYLGDGLLESQEEERFICWRRTAIVAFYFV